MAEFTQGICADGAAILKDGVMLTVEEIIELLRQGDALMGQGEPVGYVNDYQLDCIESKKTIVLSAVQNDHFNTEVYTQAPAVDGAVPNMFWDDHAPEESFAEDPCHFADAVSDDMTDYDDVFIVDVRCAKSLPNRKMKVWLEPDGSGEHYTKWEWVK